MPNKINLSSKEKRLALLRKELFPAVRDDELWSRLHDGYASVPRCLPLFLEVIDEASKKASSSGKATPAGRTYLALWCRVGDASIVKVASEKALAFEAGYAGERAVHTWREHMRVLAALGFIQFAPGAEGDFATVVVLNPYQACARLAAKGWIDPRLKNVLDERKAEVGDNSFPAWDLEAE